ncbi:uncharacterized protein [Anabrus simplex]|uniref:uncharacterized protein isoform X2 n=1 Tax=Anabrus simplex TaxID=316456 RepID=UPI0035A2F572
MRHSVHKTLLTAALLIGAAQALATGLDNEADDDYPSLWGNHLDMDDAFFRKRRGDGQEVTADNQWIMGLGVLSNMQQFFDNLRNNLESLESLPKEEREALLGPAATTPEQDRIFRPKATAAYLHALRNHRPSHKIRNFVAEPEPANLRGSNHYDPNWLWTGLGRRR